MSLSLRLSLLALIFSLFAAPAMAGSAPMARQLAVTVQIEVERAASSDVFSEGPADRGGGWRPGQVAGRGGGSGLIFDPAGLVATNAHVVSGALRVSVRLRDGRVLPARIIGVDPVLDLAVLKIEAGAPLPAVTFGDSREAREGDPVWAVGAPMGYGFSVTSGVLSGRDRFYDETFPVALLQHDAALNPGNSGGPLFDQRGQVIGVNTATPPETIFDIGVGLAIPAEVAAPALLRLAREGRLQRGRLGIAVTRADADIAAALGVDRPGLIIDSLADSGAARRAGLASGDLIVAVNGTLLTSPRDLTRALLDSRPGDAVPVTYFRDGREASASVQLEGESPAGAAPAVAAAQDTPLDPAFTLGQSDWDGGVAIGSVRADGPAALYGLRAGDRLKTVNGRAPASVEEALALLGLGRARVALLRIERPGEPPRHIVLPLTRGAAAERPVGGVVDAVVGPF